MKGFQKYPKMFWGLLAVVITVMCLYPHTVFVLLQVLAAASLPAVRNIYLNPLAKPAAGYRQWLQTVPYNDGDSLPNGSVMPEWPDLLIMAAVTLPVVLMDLDPTLRFLLALLIIGSSLAIFSLIVARDLLNAGLGEWGYVIIGLLITIFWPFQYMDRLASYHWISVLPFISCLIAFFVARAALHKLMKRYSTIQANFEPHGVWDNLPLQTIMYGRPDVMELGQPYTSLNPSATWPPVRTVHVAGCALIAALITVIVRDVASDSHGYLVAAWGMVCLYCRLTAYYSNRSLASSFWRDMADEFRHGRISRSVMLSLLFLLLVTFIFNRISVHLPKPASMVFETIAVMLLIVAAFKLPPSRSLWETTGRWRMDKEPGAWFTGIKPDRSRSFRIQKL